MKISTLIITLLMAAGTMQARDLTLRFGGKVTRVYSHSFIDRFDTKTISGPSLMVDLEIMENIILGVGYNYGLTDGKFFQFENELSYNEPFLRVKYAHPLFYWLRVYGAADFGMLFRDYKITLNTGHKAEAKDMGFSVSPMIGFEVFVPNKRFRRKSGLFQKFSIGLYFELGYSYTTPMSITDKLDLESVDDEEKGSLELNSQDYGSLGLHGLSWNVGFKILF